MFKGEVINSDIAYEYLKKKAGLPADEVKYTREQRSLSGSLMAQAIKITKDYKINY